jgi:hypothetical protein
VWKKRRAQIKKRNRRIKTKYLSPYILSPQTRFYSPPSCSTWVGKVHQIKCEKLQFSVTPLLENWTG